MERPRSLVDTARGALLGLALLVACRPSSPAPVGSVEPPAGAAPTLASSSAPAASSSPPVASAPRRLGDGCWGVELPADPPARLAALGQRCAQGMKPLLTEPRRLALASGEARFALPALPAGSCVRAAAVGAGAVTASLLDPQGASLARDGAGGFALLDASGPLCPRQGAELTLVVQGAGAEVWVQVWAAGR